MAAPLVLDFDGSVAHLAGEQRVPLQGWQEAVRFGCTMRQWRALVAQLDAVLPPTGAHGTVFTGSGDFHHLSWTLVERQLREATSSRPLRVVGVDNHPDNMRYAFGVHCGSWVRRVAALPGVAQVHVMGITSADIGLAHAWENHLAPLRSGKLTCWSVGVDTGWARWLGLGHAFRSFTGMQALVDTASDFLRRDPQPTYLSIDKDVMAPEVVRTNWDQGVLDETQLSRIVQALQGTLVGSDVTGDISAYRYRSAFKRWLSQADGQETAALDAGRLPAWQAAQQTFNQRLVLALQAAQIR